MTKRTLSVSFWLATTLMWAAAILLLLTAFGYGPLHVSTFFYASILAGSIGIALSNWMRLTGKNPFHISCRHIGHRIEHFDSGYGICGRCGSHEYFCSEEWGYEWHSALYRVYAWCWNRKEELIIWYQYNKIPTRCFDPRCGRIKKWFGIKVGDHKACDDPPF